jgi:hypothetical protein
MSIHMSLEDLENFKAALDCLSLGHIILSVNGICPCNMPKRLQV